MLKRVYAKIAALRRLKRLVPTDTILQKENNRNTVVYSSLIIQAHSFLATFVEFSLIHAQKS